MMITNKLKLDLQKPGTTPTINAVQNDSYSRNLEIALFSDRKPFVFPERGSVVIRYKKSDGKGGEYDTLPDGNPAWWAEQNLLTIALAPQVLTTPGSVLLSVTLIADGTQLSIFPIRIAVEPIAAGKLAKSEDYFYITGLLPAPPSGKVGQCLCIAAVNDKGRITALEAADGATPRKGIDYWTTADQEAIVQDVITALGTPLFGRVDAENNIILTGELADGTYTLKYEYDDHQVTTIGTLEHNTGGQSYTNQISISTDIDGSIYNGTGYAVGKRVSTDFSIKAVANPSATNVIFLTGFIPVKNGDIIRMKNCYCEALDYDNVGIYGQRSSSINIAFYDAGKTALGKVAWSAMANPNDWLSCSPFAENIVTEFTITGTAAYMRIAAAPTADASDAILTVNELID